MKTLPETYPIADVPVAPSSGRKKRSILRNILSFPAMLAVLLVVLTVLTARTRLNDPDLWWHLKTGETIWNTHTIPQTDTLSFTTNNHVWIAHEWLAQLTMYGSWKFAGYTGLMLWLCILASSLFIVSYALCSLYSGNAKVAFLGGLITWFFATVGLAVRPHIAGYLLLACELLVIHLARSRDSRWFLLLPPLFAVWVNCHGSFFFGFIVLSVFLFCSCFEMRIGSLVSQRWEDSDRTMLVLAFALSIAALFLNPLGLRQVIYPLDLLFNQSMNLRAVDEWQPLRFDQIRSFALIAIAGFIFLMTLLRQAELRLDELLLFALGFGMALRHERMLFVFGVLAAPVLTRFLSNAWDRWDPARDHVIANAIMMAGSLVVILLTFPRASELERQVTEDNPVKAVEALGRLGLSGRMLNAYEYGGYLIWAAPERKVFIDGRCDIFDWTGVLGEYGAWATLQTDPKVLLDKYRIDFCLLPRAAPMARVLPYLPGWKTVYSDKVSIIFARSAASNQPG